MPSAPIAEMPFAAFVKRLGEPHESADPPELRTVLHEIASRLDAEACVLWEPSLDFTNAPSKAAGKIYAIDSTLEDRDRLELATVPGDPIYDFSARFLRGDEKQPWHNSFFYRDMESPIRELMQRLAFRKVCVSRLEFGSLTDKPGLTGTRGKQGMISVYRAGGDEDFDVNHACALTQLAAFIPPLYRILNDRNILGLFGEVRKALHTANRQGSKTERWRELDSVCDQIGKTFRCREVSIFLRDPEGSAGRFELLSTTYPREKLACQSYVGRKSEGLTGWVLHERASVLIPDLTRFPQQESQIAKLYPGIRWNDSGGVFKHAPEFLNLKPKDPLPPMSFMACPIQSGTELLGCIRCAIGTDPYYFSWRELSILENIAAHIAEVWRQEVEKELWHSLLTSVGDQSEAFHEHITAENYDRTALYRGAAASIVRDRLRGCQIVSFRVMDNPRASQVKLLAMVAAPEVYPPDRVAAFLALPRTFQVEEGGSSIASRLLLNGPGAPSETFDLTREGDSDEQDFFRAARHVLSTCVIIDKRKQGIFDLAFSTKQHLEEALPQLADFTEIFARNLALQEFRAEQHRNLADLLLTQTEAYAHVSHQLRSPLGTAVIRTQMLSERLRTRDFAHGYSVEHELPIILGQCRKAFRVTSFLDFFAKVSRGEKIKTVIRPQSLGSLWKILIESLLDHRYTVGRHVGVNFDANDLDQFRKKHENVRLLLDLKLTEQVIDAVVGNAFKYTQRGEVVGALGELEDSQFVLKIISRGVHLSPEEARLCTQKFWRGEEAKDVDADGSGLGLFLTSLIMEAQAGSLTPFPTTAAGDTCMILRFPLHQSAYRL